MIEVSNTEEYLMIIDACSMQERERAGENVQLSSPLPRVTDRHVCYSISSRQHRNIFQLTSCVKAYDLTRDTICEEDTQELVSQLFACASDDYLSLERHDI